MRNIPETNRVRLCSGGEGRGWAGAWFTSNVMKRPHSIHPDHRHRGAVLNEQAPGSQRQEWTRPRWLGLAELEELTLLGPGRKGEKEGS